MSLLFCFVFGFIFIFSNFQDFYNKCLRYFHQEFICSQVGMTALSISVKKFYLYFEKSGFLMHLIKTNLCHTYYWNCEEEEGTNNRGQCAAPQRGAKHYMQEQCWVEYNQPFSIFCSLCNVLVYIQKSEIVKLLELYQKSCQVKAFV